MNIAFFADTFFPQVNGVVTYIVESASELTKRGHRILVFAPKPNGDYNIKPSIFSFQIKYISSISAFIYPDFRFAIPTLPKILFELKRFKVDIIHQQDPFILGSVGIIAAKILHKPVVTTFHTFFADEEMLENVKLGKIASHIERPLWKLMTYYHNLADATICPSIVAQDELIKHGLNKQSMVIPNGIDLSRIKDKKSVQIGLLRKQFSIQPSSKVAIYLGRLAVDKSIDILIESWKLVCAKITDAKLLVIGGGPREDNLKKLTEKIGLSEKIIFTGSIDRNKILSDGILYLGDIFVTASKIENQSYSILEALAHGLPIIAVAMRGNVEIIDKTNGILVPPDKPEKLAESIIGLLSNDKKRKILKNGSLKKAKQFDLVSAINQLERVYKACGRFV